MWVSKETEEVKKTKKVFEEQWQKTAQILQDTQKNQDIMKKLLDDHQVPSHRQDSHRHGST